MAEYKNVQEREELHKAIWAIADELRGAVDGWDFKAYVLGTMFYRFLSEHITGYINGLMSGWMMTRRWKPGSRWSVKRATSCCRRSFSAMSANAPKMMKT